MDYTSDKAIISMDKYKEYLKLKEDKASDNRLLFKLVAAYSAPPRNKSGKIDYKALVEKFAIIMEDELKKQKESKENG